MSAVAADSLRERQRAALTTAGEQPALLVVDVQRSFGDPEYLEGYGMTREELRAVADAVLGCARLVASARAAGIPVFWVELRSDPEHHWGASSWLHTGDRDLPLADEPCVAGTPGAEWYGLEPAEGETRVVKRGYSGFRRTDLAALLREAGTTWVVVAGLTTECCVAMTAFDAFQEGYPVVVPREATAAYSAALQEAALEQLALNAGIVLDTDDIEELWTTLLSASAVLPTRKEQLA